MLARARAFTLEGLESREVTVEVDIRPGLPAFTVVGLADAPVREARDRVRAAILNSGYQFPGRRITASMAPGDLRKIGAGLDLALACAVLAASGQIPRDRLQRLALHGELGLDGELRACRGTLAIAQGASRCGVGTLVVSAAAAREAMLVDGLRVAVARDLRAAARIVSGGPADRPPVSRQAPPPERTAGEPDLGDVLGQEPAARAMIVAAAGAHNSLLIGPPGSGKTMLAQRLPSILPPLSRSEAIEVTRIHSVAGELEHPAQLMTRRPFRAPHHPATTAGLIGGSSHSSLGEVVLAHNGVLFLDELSEFSRPAIEALRQPIEDGRVAIARAHHAAVYPARFMLVAATNPCPCGHAGTLERCHCTGAELARYRRKLSGPLLDRMDLLVGLEPQRAGRGRAAITSEQARNQVLAARERQSTRFAETGIAANAQMDSRLLRAHARIDDAAADLIAAAQARRMLSGRGVHRTLRVARTLADLESSDTLRADHIAVALSLRPAPGLPSARAA